MITCVQFFLALVLFAAVNQAGAQVSFAPATNYSVKGGASYVVAADINGNGKVDLVCVGGNTFSVFTNDGSGIFASNNTFRAGSGVDVVVGANPFLVADVNGDGKADLIYGGLIMTNNSSGGFSSNTTLNAGSFVESVAAADVNGDGHVDLITSAFTGSPKGTIVFTNNGSGGFGSNAIYNVPAISAAVDINGDGKEDLIAGLEILTNNGSGIFASNTTLNSNIGITSFTLADVNGDGKPDIIGAAPSGPSKIFVWTNNGEGVFESNATYTAGELISSITTADINGDGYPDLICANNGTFPGTLLVLTNNGSGYFGSNTTITVGNSAWEVVVADVNGDGKPDLVSVDRNDSTLSVVINTSTYPPPTSYPTPTIQPNPSDNGILVSWPSVSPGWSLQQNPDLTTANWSPSGYSGYIITDDGTNKSLVITPANRNLFFRLLHP